MSVPFLSQDQSLFFKREYETVWLQPWGPDGIRVRATVLPEFPEIPGALLDPDPAPQTRIEISEGKACLTNGKVRAEIRADGTLHFTRADTGAVLLEEPEPIFNRPPSRFYRQYAGDLFKTEVYFRPQADERFYGMGQHQHGKLNQKGCVIELEQRNTEVTIPFLVSSRGYGFLWNNPGVGRLELAENMTRWAMDATRGVDYYVTAGDNYAEIASRYADVTGHAPLLPDFALGFWQCKLRYRTQEELLEVAREYKRRGLPLSVIVSDYFHWAQMGEWAFDPTSWPDPAAMTRELKEMGVELMVSIWPTVNRDNPTFNEMLQQGLLVRTEHGLQAHLSIPDTNPTGPSLVTYYDATRPEARQYVMDKVIKNYYRNGVRVFWLDADEPEVYPIQIDNLRYHVGTALEVSCIYPLMHQQGFYEGMRAAGEKEIVTLSRSAWAGSQRYGAAVWSGDINSRFEVLRAQIPAGLNIAMSGIPWWTTDIGGFQNADIRDPYFQELIVRWFQYGVFCPLFRLHGMRSPGNGLPGAAFSGAGNEVWSFGDKAYGIIKHLLFLREKLKPYLKDLAKAASEKGLPPMRPLLFDFQGDDQAARIEDQFMLGPDLLICPVAEEGAISRKVYLPAGTTWVNAWDGKEFAGGQWLEVAAPLETIPVYWRKDSPWKFTF